MQSALKVVTGDTPPAPPIQNTLSLVRHFDWYLASNQFAETTRRNYRYWVYRMLAETCPEDFREVTEDHVAAFLESLGSRTANKVQCLHALRRFFGWCYRRGYTSTNPAEHLMPRKTIRPPVAAYSDEELARLLIAAAVPGKGERRAWTLLLQYSLAARRLEVARLRTADVDVRNGVAFLRETKGDKPRNVELGPLALAAIEGLRPWSNEYVTGGIHPQTVTAWGKQAAADAGLHIKSMHRSSHILRATAATKMLNQGIPISVVSEILGHSDVAVTSRYLATTKEQRVAAVNAL